MTDFSLDKTGSARLALEDVFRDYGLAGLDDDKLLSQVLPDLLSGAPREAALVQAAGGAHVGRLLTERINASIPPEASVRDVAAILTERTAFDATACLWVVTEYAHAIGYPVDIKPVPDTSGGMGTGATAPDGAGEVGAADTRYTPGRYTPRPSDPEKTALDPIDTPYVPPRLNRALLVIGIVVAVIVLAAGTAIAISVWPKPACHGTDCHAGPSPSTVVSTAPSTVVSSTPPSPGPTVTVTVGAIVPALSTVMPKDITVASSSCSTNDNHSYLTAVVASYACTEGSGSDMSGMKVWGYQFGNQAAFEKGVADFNRYVGFDSGKAGVKCPPSTSDGGYTTWHRNDKPNVVLGNIECYSDHSGGHDYVWTDFAEYTIIVTATTSSQSFSKLESWWENNNNNHHDA